RCGALGPTSTWPPWLGALSAKLWKPAPCQCRGSPDSGSPCTNSKAQLDLMHDPTITPPALFIHFLQNFETAVQENITINGEPWQETSDEDELQSSDIKILEDQFDELIVETASKRKQCPRKILVHIIKTIKAEQEILKLYKPVVKPQEIRPEPSQGK
uniref:NSL1 component of MIS12 kinetochore complex n=1 Tax=Crocodylus porosus TaxID=8502 RepID=A0A7M4DW76_CROPO